MDWRTIDTAPKDGTVVLIFAAGETGSNNQTVKMAYWDDTDGWTEALGDGYAESWSGTIGNWGVTHWMPLPEPPK